MGQHGPRTGTVHPPQTALVTHPNSIKNKKKDLIIFSVPQNLHASLPGCSQATPPVPALETGNTFKVLLPHDLHLTRAEPVLSASPCFLPALTQVSIHLVWKERETWRSWGKVTFPFEIISSHVSLFTSWPICSEPFSLQDEICFSLEPGDLLYNTKVTRIVPMETSTKEVNSSCSCHSYKGKRGAL